MRIGGISVPHFTAVTVTVAAGRIAAVERGCERCDLGGSDVFLASGFCDLQLNGFGGADFNLGAWATAGESRLDAGAVRDAAARRGTALFCPTVSTNSREAMLAALAALRRAMDEDRRLDRAIPGIHVEGPYISPEDGPRGAHPEEHVRPPDWEEFARFQEAAGGRIRLVTLAPEVEGGLRFLERLVESGVVGCIGHTAAAPERIGDAVRAGATVATHLGNGAHAVLPRHPNYLWEQLASDALFATFIADGHHLPAAALSAMLRAKGPRRSALVSDAVSLGGCPPGLYAGGRHEVLPGGKIVLAGTPYLAGAGHLLDTGVANAVRLAGLSLSAAVGAVTSVPARILSLQDRKGRLDPGFDADFTLFRIPEAGPLEIAATVCGGEVVYREDRASSRAAAR